jgi:hypothetical protein
MNTGINILHAHGSEDCMGSKKAKNGVCLYACAAMCVIRDGEEGKFLSFIPLYGLPRRR